MTPQHRHATIRLRHAKEGNAGSLQGPFRRCRRVDDAAERSHLVAFAVARAKQGDRDALRYLYVQYANNVYGYVLSILHDDQEAEDVTQQVFAKLMTVLPKYERRAVPFSAWILRVARNVAVDHMRRRRSLLCEEVREADGDVRELRQDEALSVREALAALPPEQRQVVMLRHVVGLTPGEIASQMGKTESSIHGLHHRGRSALRESFTELGLAPRTAA